MSDTLIMSFQSVFIYKLVYKKGYTDGIFILEYECNDK